MSSKGAGGSNGGVGEFIIGFVMMCGGVYMLLQSITVTNRFGFGAGLYSMGWVGGGTVSITGGTVMLPFILGVGMIFYNSRNYLGWFLAAGSLIALVFGVISNIQFSMRSMSAFDLIIILVLSVGGLGIFLRSLQEHRAK